MSTRGVPGTSLLLRARSKSEDVKLFQGHRSRPHETCLWHAWTWLLGTPLGVAFPSHCQVWQVSRWQRAGYARKHLCRAALAQEPCLSFIAGMYWERLQETQWHYKNSFIHSIYIWEAKNKQQQPWKDNQTSQPLSNLGYQCKISRNQWPALLLCGQDSAAANSCSCLHLPEAHPAVHNNVSPILNSSIMRFSSEVPEKQEITAARSERRAPQHQYQSSAVTETLSSLAQSSFCLHAAEAGLIYQDLSCYKTLDENKGRSF